MLLYRILASEEGQCWVSQQRDNKARKSRIPLLSFSISFSVFICKCVCHSSVLPFSQSLLEVTTHHVFSSLCLQIFKWTRNTLEIEDKCISVEQAVKGITIFCPLPPRVGRAGGKSSNLVIRLLLLLNEASVFYSRVSSWLGQNLGKVSTLCKFFLNSCWV